MDKKREGMIDQNGAQSITEKKEIKRSWSTPKLTKTPIEETESGSFTFNENGLTKGAS